MKGIKVLLFAILVMILGLSACGSDVKENDWKNIVLGDVIPDPLSKMEIVANSEEWLVIYVYDISENDFYEYVRQCGDEKEFTIDVQNYSSSFSAFNQAGYYLSLFYDNSVEKMNITLDIPMIMEKYELPTYAITANLPLPKSELGSYNWENDDSFFLFVGDMTIDDYKLYKEECVNAGFSIEPYEGEMFYSAISETGYKLSIGYEGYNRIKIELYCPKTEEDNTENGTEKEDAVTDNDDNFGNATTIIVTMREDEFVGLHYKEVEELLKNMGFVNFEYEILETNDQSEDDGSVSSVEIKNWALGKGDFSKGDTYESDAIVVIWYYECIDNTSEVMENLTIENNADLKALLELKDPNAPSVSDFANKYKGQIIEFDGCVGSMMNHGDYDTRFNILICAGDYNENGMSGPNFRLTDVNAYDMELDTLWLEDVLFVGTNIHIIAEVDEYNSNSELFELDVIKVEIR